MHAITHCFAIVLLTLCLEALAAGPRRDVMIDVAPNVKIHVIESGPSSDQPALVLIPGWRLPASIWTSQIDIFSSERRVLAIDSRSQGESSKTLEGNTPEQRARDLNQVLLHERLDSIVLVGWSQGVQDVAAFVEQFGTNRIKAIVLVDAAISSGARDIAEHPTAAAQQFERLDIYSSDPKAYTEGMMKAIIGHPMRPQEFAQLVAQAMETPTAIGEAMLISDMFGRDRSGSQAKFDRPTLVVATSTSGQLEDQKVMATKLPNGHFEVVQDARHAVFVDQPIRFAKLVQDFIGSVTKAHRA